MSGELHMSDELRAILAPIEVPGMRGITAWAGFTAMTQLSNAVGMPAATQLLEELLRLNPKVIEEAVPRLFLNPDRSRWQGSIDDIPLPVAELGKLLADCVHRRIYGLPLTFDGEAE